MQLNKYRKHVAKAYKNGDLPKEEPTSPPKEESPPKHTPVSKVTTKVVKGSGLTNGHAGKNGHNGHLSDKHNGKTGKNEAVVVNGNVNDEKPKYDSNNNIINNNNTVNNSNNHLSNNTSSIASPKSNHSTRNKFNNKDATPLFAGMNSAFLIDQVLKNDLRRPKTSSTPERVSD